MSISSNLKTIRKERNLSQADLSELSGISDRTISDIETDAHSNTTIFILCSLCNALDITPNDLIPEEMYK